MRLGCTGLALVGLLALPASACPSSSNNSYFKFNMLPIDRLVTGHGSQVHPVTKVAEFHYGIDVAGKRGDAVTAVEGGRIILAEHAGKLGFTVLIEHAGGWTTNYAHLGSIAVQAGECVSAGEAIGTVGSSGLADRPVLHFEIIKDGVSIDPVRCERSAMAGSRQAVCMSNDHR